MPCKNCVVSGSETREKLKQLSGSCRKAALQIRNTHMCVCWRGGGHTIVPRALLFLLTPLDKWQAVISTLYKASDSDGKLQAHLAALRTVLDPLRCLGTTWRVKVSAVSVGPRRHIFALGSEACSRCLLQVVKLIRYWLRYSVHETPKAPFTSLTWLVADLLTRKPGSVHQHWSSSVSECFGFPLWVSFHRISAPSCHLGGEQYARQRHILTPSTWTTSRVHLARWTVTEVVYLQLGYPLREARQNTRRADEQEPSSVVDALYPAPWERLTYVTRGGESRLPTQHRLLQRTGNSRSRMQTESCRKASRRV
jgi:hypothetical protein